MPVRKYQFVPNSSPEKDERNSKTISDELQAAGIDVEVELDHVTGECVIRWGLESKYTPGMKSKSLLPAQEALMQTMIRSKDGYERDLL